MARRTNHSFNKRLKERQRKEKADKKLQRKLQRKQPAPGELPTNGNAAEAPTDATNPESEPTRSGSIEDRRDAVETRDESRRNP